VSQLDEMVDNNAATKKRKQKTWQKQVTKRKKEA